MQTGFKVLEGFPADVLAVEAVGVVDRAAYDEVLIPAVEAMIAAEGRMNLLYIIGPGFEGYTAGAAMEDAKLGFAHLADFARIALVSDVEWIRLGVKAFSPLIPGAVKLFALADLEAAKAWVCARVAPQDEGPGVAADRKILPLEDRLPIER